MVVQTAINIAEYLGIAIVVVVVVARAVDTPNGFLRHNYLWALNLSVGGLCFVALATMATVYGRRVLQAKWWGPSTFGLLSGSYCT